MAINGYRTIPTDGSGELYSWPGCVVLVSSGWSDGPAFAERVAHTDHDDAAIAFRDLAGWLLARSGDTVADFAAVLQTGSSLLCMAAGDSEVLVGDGRRVVADVSGMWAQLVLAERPDRIELGVSAGVEPDRVNLEHGVVPADGVLLIPGGGDAPGSQTAATASDATAGSPTTPQAAPPTPAAGGGDHSVGGTRAAEPAGSTVGGSDTDSHPSAGSDEPAAHASEGDSSPADGQLGGIIAPGQATGASVKAAEAGSEAPASSGGQRLVTTTDDQAATAGTSEATPEPADSAQGDVGSDPRGSPGAASAGQAQARHQLPFDAEVDGGPATDADGLVGLVSEEPEPSGASGSDPSATARSADPEGEAGVEGPEPTGEHLSASTFVEDAEHDDHLIASPPPEHLPEGEATGLVPIVTTPSVPGGSVSGQSGPGSEARSPAEAPGPSHRGFAPSPPDEAWPPPPAWAPGGASTSADLSEPESGDPRLEDSSAQVRSRGDSNVDAGGFGVFDAGSNDHPSGDDPSQEHPDVDDDDLWAEDWVVAGDVGSADADLVTDRSDADGASDEGSDSEAEDAPGDDTNEREWDSDGLDDDQSIPLLLFDDGVAVELPGDVLIGRRPDPGVRDDPSRLHTLTMTDDSQAVSRNHVELRRRHDEVSIVDCGSANGTFVEATPGELTRLEAEAPHVLRDGERVVFGKRWFEYRAPRPSDSDD